MEVYALRQTFPVLRKALLGSLDEQDSGRVIWKVFIALSVHMSRIYASQIGLVVDYDIGFVNLVIQTK
jgi:hypothetical protein